MSLAHAEQQYLEAHGAAHALVGERKLALGLARHALLRMGCDEDQTARTLEAMRRRPSEAAT